MHATGHYGAALLVYAPVVHVFIDVAPLLTLIGGAGVLAFSTLPDVDNYLPFVRHRSVTHTVPFLLGVSLVLAGFAWWLAGHGVNLPGSPLTAAAAGFGVGFLGIGSHLLADTLTPMGVPLLWPLSQERFTLDLTRADNSLANWMLLVAGISVSGVVFVSASL